MNTTQRRNYLYQTLKAAQTPVSASALAAQTGVSRQVIVGDIALLRAQGCDIVATTKGYTIAKPAATGRYTAKIACLHTLPQTETELNIIVSFGGEVLDVIVEHALYGEITGQLGIASAEDVAAFMQGIGTGEARLLSDLTHGVHLHTISCRDRQAFERICTELCREGLLYNPGD